MIIDPAWATAYTDIAYFLYMYYGDVPIVRKYYDGMKKWVMFLYDSAKQSGLDKLYSKYGDWVPPPPHPKCSGGFTSSYFLIQNLKELGVFARAIGNTKDAEYFESSFKSVVQLFHQTFYNQTGKYYDTGLQSAQSMALQMGVTEGKQDVVNFLLQDVKNQGNSLTTGIWGTKYLMEVLSREGHTDIALQLAKKTTYPSWGYMIYNTNEPATTLWELWNTDTGDAGMDSRNHIMFGSIGSWFYKFLAGIEPMKPGYEMVSLQPAVRHMESLNAEIQSIRGKIAVKWDRISENITNLQVQIPTNSIAHLKLEFKQDQIMWDDKQGIRRVIESDDRLTTFELGSGTYTLTLEH
jgi:alpha-L-rhamnosidase